MERLFFLVGSISALIAVVLGAFGAHGLKGRLTTEMLNAFEVGVRYQMYHALALLAAAWALSRWPRAEVTVAGWLFVCAFMIAVMVVTVTHKLRSPPSCQTEQGKQP